MNIFLGASVFKQETWGGNVKYLRGIFIIFGKDVGVKKD